MTPADAPAWLADRPEIETIFACICDLNGVMRGKRVPVDQLDKITSGALRMPLSLLSMDIWGEDIEDNELVFDTGDADGLCDFTGRPLSPVELQILDWTELSDRYQSDPETRRGFCARLRQLEIEAGYAGPFAPYR